MGDDQDVSNSESKAPDVGSIAQHNGSDGNPATSPSVLGSASSLHSPLRPNPTPLMRAVHCLKTVTSIAN